MYSNYGLLADGVAVFHFVFVLFAVGGAALVHRWPRLVWLHLPAAAWGAVVMLTGWICPLTPLEFHLRDLADQTGYDGGFIEQYIFGIIYPAGLTRVHQIVMGVAVGLLNGALYAHIVWRRLRG